MRLASHLQALASDLGDAEPGFEFARWSRADLLTYWNEAVGVIATLRPDLFSRPVKVKLEPGSLQDLSCCCAQVGKVIGQADAGGRMIGPVRVIDDAAASRWTKPSCLAGGKTRGGAPRVSSYSKDPHSNAIIFVNPPVPPGADAYLLVSCTTTPTPVTDPERMVSDVECGNVAAVRQWVLFRALYRDDEASTEYRKALTSLKLFFTLIQAKFRAELFYELGIVPVPRGTQLLNTTTGTEA